MKRQTGHRRPVMLAVLCFLLIGGVIIAGCGGGTPATTAAPTTLATATTAAPGTTDTEVGLTGKTYSNTENGFTFQYPEEWQVDEIPSVGAEAGTSSVLTVGVFDPKGAEDGTGDIVDGFVVSVYKLNATVAKSDMPAIQPEIEALMTKLKAQSTDFQEVEPLTEDELNGMPCFVGQYSSTQNGTPIVTVIAFVFNGNLEYQLSFQAAADSVETIEASFVLIRDSFKATGQ